MNDATRFGTLVLVPNTLDLGTDSAALQDVLPLAAIRRAAALDHWVVENAKSTRAFLKRVNEIVPLATVLQSIDIVELPRPPKGRPNDAPPDLSKLLAPALNGHDIGLHSEAGMPAVADPGSELVAAAHRNGVPVLSLTGPNSLVMALSASGLNGQSFAFNGYLPTDASLRAARIKELEALSRRAKQAQLVIETPYRNAALLDALVMHLQGSTRLSVSCGLTLATGWTRTDTVGGWKSKPREMPSSVPAVFSFQA